MTSSVPPMAGQYPCVTWRTRIIGRQKTEDRRQKTEDGRRKGSSARAKPIINQPMDTPAISRVAGSPPLVDRSAQIRTVGATVAAVVHYRQLIRSLVAKDLKLKYRGSVLGFVWSLVSPLLMLGV